MDTSLLQQELEPLNAQIERVREQQRALEEDLQTVEAELATRAAERERFAALEEVCQALDKLGELGAGELFWGKTAASDAAATHLGKLRGRIAAFAEETRGTRERQAALREELDQGDLVLNELFLEVQDAHAREERRRDEFVIEREETALPFLEAIMPWTREAESERRFRKALGIALCWSVLFGVIVPLVTLPIPDRTQQVVEIPERIAMLVKEEMPQPPPPKPKPVEPKAEEKPEEPQPPQKQAEKHHSEKPAPTSHAQPAGKQEQPAQPAGGGVQNARKKAEHTGVLAFKSSFKDLMDEVPVAKLGNEARLNKKAPVAAGQAVAHRSLVALEAKNGGSGGISNFGVSRNLGSGGGNGGGPGTVERIGGVGFARVESKLANLTESARPLSDGPGAGRTDEEIQIVFDRYKAALYRIYNTELRKDPTLRGKMLLRIIIEPDGTVSFCKVESTDLASPELVAQIVARVKRFNFGPKEDVPKTTILYPIDFLPAS